MGYSDTDIRDMEAEGAESYSRVAGGDQAAELGPKPLPAPRRPADEDRESALPAPQQPVVGLGSSVLTPARATPSAQSNKTLRWQQDHVTQPMPTEQVNSS